MLMPWEQLYESSKQATQRWSVRPVLRKRETDGAFSTLVQNLKKEDPEWFFVYLRMTPAKSKEVLAIVESRIESKQPIGEDLFQQLKDLH
ncbi:hypothetical protein QYM36_019143 [Artemia franciscana]|uniref:Uncharacterized protein n=1 Tax=Artemia franciscana TaxID=6661 RepID=A0AA88KTT8_ARTSF|nr:hypothetical protein QYM36_019143 [Artemia franciscana]